MLNIHEQMKSTHFLPLRVVLLGILSELFNIEIASK